MGDDAITNVKNLTLNTISETSLANDQKLKENVELVFLFVSCAVNGRNLKETLGKSFLNKNYDFGDVCNAYSAIATFIPAKDKEAIKEMIDKTNDLLNYKYIPF